MYLPGRSNGKRISLTNSAEGKLNIRKWEKEKNSTPDKERKEEKKEEREREHIRRESKHEQKNVINRKS